MKRPALVVFAVLAAQVLLLLLVATRATGGHFIYPVDDAYIHLALARSLGERGVYAVTGDAFAPASSSILYPYLLSVARKGTTSEYVPLMFGLLGLAWLARTFVRGACGAPERPSRKAIASIAALAVVPVAPVVLTGMEHTLHAASCLALVVAAARLVRAQQAAPFEFAPSTRPLLGLSALAALSMSLRYESLFVALAVASMLALKRRTGAAFAVAVGTLVPMLAFGGYLQWRAGIFFPASVLLKREHLDASNIVPIVVYKWSHAPYLVGLVAALVLALVITRRARAERSPPLLAISLLVLVLHVTFAKNGWLYRYEAYGLTLALFSLLEGVRELESTWTEGKKRAQCVALAAALLLAPLAYRAAVSNRSVVLASQNIFDQQMQSARFLETLPRGTVVALNDLGAPAYFSERPIVDLMGLGTLEVARAREFRIERALSREEVVRLTRGVDVAIVYPEWFEGAIPEGWSEIARWTIRDNRVAAKETVAIYCCKPELLAPLSEKARAFEAHLPERVAIQRVGLPKVP